MEDFYTAYKDTIDFYRCNASIGTALQILTPKAQWCCIDDNYSTLVWLDTEQQKPTLEEVEGVINMLSNLKPYYELRIRRNILLAKTDIYLIQDFPITPEQKLEYIEYRQSLRDLPKNIISNGVVLTLENIDNQFPTQP